MIPSRVVPNVVPNLCIHICQDFADLLNRHDDEVVHDQSLDLLDLMLFTELTVIIL